MRFSAKEAAPCLTAAALLVATALCLSGGRTIYGDPNGEVPLEMPDSLGPWTGESVLFCQNDQCARSFPESTLPAGGTERCPVCDGALSTVSLGENNLLPSDTPIFRKIYHRPGFPDIQATVVFSGMERRSIHRPQRCLVGQGNKILDERTEWFKCASKNGRGRGGNVPLRVLQLAFQVKDPTTGKTVAQVPNVYGYWLFNPEYETVHHLARFWRMLLDNCFRSYRPRWGYASLSIEQKAESPDEWRSAVEDFLPRFRPVIDDVRATLRARHDVSMHIDGTSASANNYSGTNIVTTSRGARSSADPVQTNSLQQ